MSESEKVTNQNSYEKISNKSTVKSNSSLAIAQFASAKRPLNLIFFKESERSFLNTSEQYFDINWNYKIDNNVINTDEILLFKNNAEYIILIPTFSEEFPTFQTIGITNAGNFVDYGLHTYSGQDYEKLGNISFDNVDYQIKKLKNELRIYAVVNQKEILLSDYSKSNQSKNNDITASEKNEVEKLQKQNIVENSKEVAHKIVVDLDSDGKKENIEVNFKKKSIDVSENLKKEIFFSNEALVIQKEFEDNNPHDISNYKYFFKEFNNSIILEKVEFKRETYAEQVDLCHINFTYFPNKIIYLSEVDFFNQKYLNSLNRNISLKDAIEITKKVNQNYQCTSNISEQELEYMLTKIALSNVSVNEYNNLAYYLEQNKQYSASKYLLETILEKYPHRVVAWLNYGDTLWELNEKSRAKSAYQKYKSLMKSQGKDLSKIPLNIEDRIKQ
ncbi:tetratricopeptide repeat protein [Epilithonimonas sp.]|uniref:tetratricopeptide repeat protein n=1 Tax=Epilithonimonas sp. TaxID=2894511 RepID=UPI002FDEA1FD